MIKSYARGHEIHYDVEWKYMDNGNPIDNMRPCKKCGRAPVLINGVYVDACMGYTENATSACCGHGVEDSYVVYGKE